MKGKILRLIIESTITFLAAVVAIAITVALGVSRLVTDVTMLVVIAIVLFFLIDPLDLRAR